MAEHGTKAKYDREKCRCEECRAAARDYMRRYRGSPLAAWRPPEDSEAIDIIGEILSWR